MLLTQTLYELGNDNWSLVCDVLCHHPLIDNGSNVFTPEMCQVFYKYLAQEMPQDTEGRDEFKAHSKPHAPFHLHLARKHYKARVVELRLAIIENEQTFKKITVEMSALQNGEWDDKLRADVRLHRRSISTQKDANKWINIKSENTPTFAKTPAASYRGRREPRSHQLLPEYRRRPRALSFGDSEDESPRTLTGSARGDPKSATDNQCTELPTEFNAATETSEIATRGRRSSTSFPIGTVSNTQDGNGPKRKGKRRASQTESMRASKRRQTSEDHEEAVESPAGARSLLPRDHKATILNLHGRIISIRQANIFAKKLKIAQYEEYVMGPRSLHEIKARVGKDIMTLDQYRAEVHRMLCNALMYNTPNTSTYDDCQLMFHSTCQVEHRFRVT
ncbi:hypothetical protein BKA62DRAFT_718078 [Auriculariales sp. MPI-PUGE-AT-0066]|nr:hypothetical protein BKA62DRAFT_718078 [Auriculariales sp. MPI-PUGE-AT-0066]